MDDAEKQQLLQAVEDATLAIVPARAEAKRLMDEARLARAAAIRAADDAGVPREEIAKVAGAKWPMSSAAWSRIRRGITGRHATTR